ncbi:MAG: hypothetical protein M3O50_12385, partial [Myxococcota bacterium]|nr:hypothetical protein [Myxococcota bacterium]
ATIIIPPTAGRAIDEVAIALNGGRVPTADIALGVRSFPELDVLAAELRRGALGTRALPLAGDDGARGSSTRRRPPPRG